MIDAFSFLANSIVSMEACMYVDNTSQEVFKNLPQLLYLQWGIEFLLYKYSQFFMRQKNNWLFWPPWPWKIRGKKINIGEQKYSQLTTFFYWTTFDG